MINTERPGHLHILVDGAGLPNHSDRMTQQAPDVGLMVGQRLRRWPNIKQTSGQRLGIAGSLLMMTVSQRNKVTDEKFTKCSDWN